MNIPESGKHISHSSLSRGLLQALGKFGVCLLGDFSYAPNVHWLNCLFANTVRQVVTRCYKTCFVERLLGSHFNYTANMIAHRIHGTGIFTKNQLFMLGPWQRWLRRDPLKCDVWRHFTGKVDGAVGHSWKKHVQLSQLVPNVHPITGPAAKYIAYWHICMYISFNITPVYMLVFLKTHYFTI